MYAGRLQSRGYPGLGSGSTLVRDTYGDSVDNVVLIVAGSSASSLGEHDKDWKLGDAQLWRHSDVRTNLRVNFTVIQKRFPE